VLPRLRPGSVTFLIAVLLRDRANVTPIRGVVPT